MRYKVHPIQRLKEIFLKSIQYARILALIALCSLYVCEGKKKNSCCGPQVGPRGNTGPRGPRGFMGASGASGVGVIQSYISVFSLTGQQSDVITPPNNEINGTDAVAFEAAIPASSGWTLSVDNQTLSITLASAGVFMINYWVNAQSNYPFVSYLTLNGTEISGSEISVPATQAPGEGSVGIIIPFAAGTNTLQLIFNGAITPQNSTSVHASNATRNINCVSAALSIIQIG